MIWRVLWPRPNLKTICESAVSSVQVLWPDWTTVLVATYWANLGQKLPSARALRAPWIYTPSWHLAHCWQYSCKLSWDEVLVIKLQIVSHLHGNHNFHSAITTLHLPWTLQCLHSLCTCTCARDWLPTSYCQDGGSGNPMAVAHILLL